MNTNETSKRNSDGRGHLLREVTTTVSCVTPLKNVTGSRRIRGMRPLAVNPPTAKISALAEAGEEIEKLDRKCQVEEASENAQVGESGAEASSSCEAPQSATQTDEESGEDRVGAPSEIESEPVTGGGFTAKEESSEMQTTPVAEEWRGLALLERRVRFGGERAAEGVDNDKISDASARKGYRRGPKH
ncbi:hypothetical protein HPB50_016969 [Hyalomma asiaticum]|uniref:Uncharacterized protein n=1 Tax=Hyalomma asiaticum TaxID=266040 RepID=A0ACB7TM30_HYAAI|nr:hypothetical protein HPB50_016969 [Hyalomma asiaticum]